MRKEVRKRNGRAFVLWRWQGIMAFSLSACGSSAQTGAAGTQSGQSEAAGETAQAGTAAASEGTRRTLLVFRRFRLGTGNGKLVCEGISRNTIHRRKFRPYAENRTASHGCDHQAGADDSIRGNCRMSCPLRMRTCAKQLVAADKVWDMKSFLETYDPDSHLLKDFRRISSRL